MSKYEDRVKKVTDELYACYTMCASDDNPFEMMARLSVAREAESYQTGYMSNYFDDSVDSKYIWESTCECEMIEMGLIPPPNETI